MTYQHRHRTFVYLLILSPNIQGVHSLIGSEQNSPRHREDNTQNHDQRPLALDCRPTPPLVVQQAHLVRN